MRARSLASTLALLTMMFSAPALVPDAFAATAEEKCINSLNKDFWKASSAQAKENAACMKDSQTGKLGATAAQDCLELDRKGKVDKAIIKAFVDDLSLCGVPPTFGPLDGQAGAERAVQKELTTLSSLFGADLDAALLSGKDAQNCQFKTLKMINKCSDTRLKEFVSCKKLGIAGGTITDGSSLQDECLGTGSGQPDPKGKIGKACDLSLEVSPGKFKVDKIRSQISKCESGGIPLDQAFPGCGTPSATALHACIDARVSCEMCRFLNEADDLVLNCDQFDDGSSNGSCESSDVQATLQALSRVEGVSPETIYFSAQSSTCADCTDSFGLDTQLADAWSALSYHFTFDDADSGSFAATGNSRNSQVSGSPRGFHTFECIGETDPNWNPGIERCVFNVGVRVQAPDGDFDDDFIEVSVQPLQGVGAYYQTEAVWCVSAEADYAACPHNDSARHLTNSPAAGGYANRLVLFARGSATAYAPVCVGADEQNVTVASYGSGARPVVEQIRHSTRPGTCLTSYTDASLAAIASSHAPARDSAGNLSSGYGFNTRFTGLRVGSIVNGPSYHLTSFHDLDMDWEASGAYNGEIVVHTAAWNCKNSAGLLCSNVPYSAFSSYTSIVSKSNAANLAPVNIACFDGCGGTNFVFADIEVNRSYEHNARFMGLWGAIFSNNWLRGNHVGGNGGKERLTVRPIEVPSGMGGTLHDLNKNPEVLDGVNNYRSEETTADYYNRYNVAVDNLFNQASHDANHVSAAMLHLGGNYTGEFGNRFIADDSGGTNTQTQLTGRYKIIRETEWAEGYNNCSLRTGFYADDTLYNDASTIYVEAPITCSGSFDWPDGIEGLSYGLAPGSDM